MDNQVDIQLPVAEAVVLYEWITRFNARDYVEFEDQAEQRVLWNLEALLEQRLEAPFRDNYTTLLAESRDMVRDPTE